MKGSIIIILPLLLLGCAKHHSLASDSKYFANPPSAVEQITVMMEEEDWIELAKYYDLRDSSISRSVLTRGEFFYTDERPPVAHPAGFWHYKHPFSPGFKYHSFRE